MTTTDPLLTPLGKYRTDPLPVMVMRPGPTGTRLLAELQTTALFLALRAWVVMAVLGHFGLARYGFWDAVLLCIGLSMLRGVRSEYLSWTHLAPRKR